jgi:uncharacterized protein DUF4154
VNTIGVQQCGRASSRCLGPPSSLRHDENWLFAGVLALALMGAGLRAQTARPLDYAVKAVYLLNFGRFTTWPTATGGPDANSFSLCILGRDPFGPTLDATVATELIDHKAVVTRRVSGAGDTAGCRILFVSASEDHQLKPILQAIDKASVLTVSDVPHFVERGGMIQFVMENNKVRFEINLAAAERVGLILSSELLRVAVSVKTAAKSER